MTGRLASRTAVITGGCSGIGRATARRFAEEGANVVLADIDDDRGRHLAADLDALFVRTDVTDKTQVDALYAAANETYGSVDIAFNNAGISPPEDGSILDVDLDTWRRVQEVNVTSVYCAARRCCPTCSSGSVARSSTMPRWSR
jgi:NAD(P)-dependent dehydrogenase (short-subunit alcohol dehydrogenase family)